MTRTYQRLPSSRREIAERPLVATDGRNPDPVSLGTRMVMLANIGRGTSPELVLRRALWTAGMRGYRLNPRIEGVRPDIAFGPSRVAIFVHGCFWHRCTTCRYPLPRSHREFWVAKFRRNRSRDRMKRHHLERAGWRVIEVWAHEIRDQLDPVVRSIRRAVV